MTAPTTAPTPFIWDQILEFLLEALTNLGTQALKFIGEWLGQQLAQIVNPDDLVWKTLQPLLAELATGNLTLERRREIHRVILDLHAGLGGAA